MGVLIAVCTYWYLQKCGYVAMVYHSIRMIDIHCAYSLGMEKRPLVSKLIIVDCECEDHKQGPQKVVMV